MKAKRLEEIEARAKAANGGSTSWPGADSPNDVHAAQARIALASHARSDVPWLCEKLREAVTLLAFATPDLDTAAKRDGWYARRAALLAALDEVTR